MGLSSITHSASLVPTAAISTPGFSAATLQGDTLSKSKTFAAGTSAGQADLYYATSGTVNTSGTTFDLAGSLLDPIAGGPFTPAKITSITIFKTSTGAGNLVVGGGSNALAGVTGFADPIFKMVSDTGIPVTASTADILKLAASTGTIGYQMVLTGRSV